MKIAILTQPLRNNYGGILQSYALQKTLQRMGHEVIVVNREYSLPSFKTLILRVGSMLKSIVRVLILKRENVIIMSPFSPYYHADESGYDVLPFVNNNICQSPRIRTSKALRKFIMRNNFDACVVGSDQVWRPKYSPCITDFFLKGIPMGHNMIRIAFSASFGTDTWEFSHKDTLACADLAKRFDAVSVREKSAIRLCKQYLGVDAIHLIDPTLLLIKEDYIDLLHPTAKTENLLVCYILDKTDQKTAIATEIMRSLGYQIQNINIDGNNSRQLSVEEWIDSFHRADFIFTDSFHGCVFSVIFRKPFIVFGNIDRGLSRFDSLLNMFDLKNRMVTSYDDYKNRCHELLMSFNYNHVDSIIACEQKKSLEFLTKYLTEFYKTNNNA